MWIGAHNLQAVIDCNIFPMLNDLLNSGAEYKTRKEAAWAILNATSGGTHAQIRSVTQFVIVQVLGTL